MTCAMRFSLLPVADDSGCGPPYIMLKWSIWKKLLYQSTVMKKSDTRLAQTEQLEACFTSEQKELFQMAAELEGITLYDFIVRSAQEQASHIIAEHNRIRLGFEDSLAFAESLLDPPEPNQRMMAAAAAYKRAIGL